MREPTEMELRVAKALFDDKPPHPQAEFSRLPSDMRRYYIDRARAAIRAMREPSDAMMSAWANDTPARADEPTVWKYRRGIWQAMIDTASPKVE